MSSIDGTPPDLFNPPVGCPFAPRCEYAMEICKKEKEVSGYLDVAYQHMGKLYFDFGDYKQALHYFYKALDLRKLKKDQSLIESTEIAIEVTKKKLL